MDRSAAIEGSLLGLALGDAIGARHEGGLVGRGLWALIGRTRRGLRRYTDDTRMTIDLLETLRDTGHVEQDRLAARFAASHHWSRGYGPGTRDVLERIRDGESWRCASAAAFDGGSWGNGAAMRVAPLGPVFAPDLEAVASACRASAVVTHGHPLAIEGAVLVGIAAALSCEEVSSETILAALESVAGSEEHRTRIRTARRWIARGEVVESRAVRDDLGNGVSAVESCATAIYLAVAHREAGFEALMARVVEVGGDVDTIGAMAGGIWGARRGAGALPVGRLDQLEDRERLAQLARDVAAADLDESEVHPSAKRAAMTALRAPVEEADRPRAPGRRRRRAWIVAAVVALLVSVSTSVTAAVFATEPSSPVIQGACIAIAAVGVLRGAVGVTRPLRWVLVAFALLGCSQVMVALFAA